MRPTYYVIRHKRKQTLFIRRNEIADFPMLFHKRDDAEAALTATAQVTDDWEIEPVALTFLSEPQQGE